MIEIPAKLKFVFSKTIFYLSILFSVVLIVLLSSLDDFFARVTVIFSLALVLIYVGVNYSSKRSKELSAELNANNAPIPSSEKNHEKVSLEVDNVLPTVSKTLPKQGEYKDLMMHLKSKIENLSIKLSERHLDNRHYGPANIVKEGELLQLLLNSGLKKEKRPKDDTVRKWIIDARIKGGFEKAKPGPKPKSL